MDEMRKADFENPTPRKRRRPDLLPEYCEYPDVGCSLSPACLNCPLPRCAQEKATDSKSRRRSRAAEILHLHLSQRISVNELARRFGISRRTVQRALSTAARNNGNTPISKSGAAPPGSTASS